MGFGRPLSTYRQPRGIKATKTQDATTHHQRTHVTDLYADDEGNFDADQWAYDRQADEYDHRGDR